MPVGLLRKPSDSFLRRLTRAGGVQWRRGRVRTGLSPGCCLPAAHLCMTMAGQVNQTPGFYSAGDAVLPFGWHDHVVPPFSVSACLSHSSAFRAFLVGLHACSLLPVPGSEPRACSLRALDARVRENRVQRYFALAFLGTCHSALSYAKHLPFMPLCMTFLCLHLLCDFPVELSGTRTSAKAFCSHSSALLNFSLPRNCAFMPTEVHSARHAFTTHSSPACSLHSQVSKQIRFFSAGHIVRFVGGEDDWLQRCWLSFVALAGAFLRPFSPAAG